MSLSWTRIIPEGKELQSIHWLLNIKCFQVALVKGIDSMGLLCIIGIFLQSLQDEYGGFLDVKRLPEDFNYYAEVCFREFGDFIKNWMTFNEPHTYCKLGFGYNGPHAPGRTDDRTRSLHGDPSTEVWIAGHSTLLAHAKAIQTFRQKYQKEQGGRISIAINSDWFEPQTQDPKDVLAAARRLDFMLR